VSQTQHSDKLPLSLAIICLNEAANIERCIRSVPIANDIVVVDSGSRDETVAIAKRCGARVFNYEWRGFRDQKRLATELCANDWVLSLDADEALSPEALAEIKAMMSESQKTGKLESTDGFEFPRLTWNLGRWIRHGGWYPDWQLRLYHRGRARWEGGEHVHERVEALRHVRLQQPILHWPFSSLAEQIETNNRYSGLGARELVRRGKKFSLTKLMFKPVSKFLETYLLKGGFRDGLPGFIISVGAAYSVFLKFAKLWEMENQTETSQK
jgi:glycosyltransferase involved in cell wall biosynthesis